MSGDERFEVIARELLRQSGTSWDESSESHRRVYLRKAEDLLGALTVRGYFVVGSPLTMTEEGVPDSFPARMSADAVREHLRGGTPPPDSQGSEGVETTRFPMQEQRSPCPHGDPTCPCPDRYGDHFDHCHYEHCDLADHDCDPMPCPTTGLVGCMICKRLSCPDGGTCHHACVERCWRVDNAAPLSGVYPDDEWPLEVREHVITAFSEPVWQGSREAFESAWQGSRDDRSVVALDEGGMLLASHISSSDLWGRHDIGVGRSGDPRRATWNDDVYDERYGHGLWRVEWTDDVERIKRLRQRRSQTISSSREEVPQSRQSTE